MLSFDHQNHSKWHKWCHVRFKEHCISCLLHRLTGQQGTSECLGSVICCQRLESPSCRTLSIVAMNQSTLSLLSKSSTLSLDVSPGSRLLNDFTVYIVPLLVRSQTFPFCHWSWDGLVQLQHQCWPPWCSRMAAPGWAVSCCWSPCLAP